MKVISGADEMREVVTVIPSHMLKIEAVGDFAGRKIKPRIRLTGHWLERAGFKPGHRVCILSLKPGELTLQFREAADVPA